MAKVRDILCHVTVEVAASRRKCHRSRGKHSIAKDVAHLAVKGGPFGARQNYCATCAKSMLSSARMRLNELELQLGLGGSE